MPLSLASRLLIALFAVAAPALGATTSSLGVLPPQTFQSGLRWRLDAPATAPWIPRSVVFAARGELVWSGPSIANPNLLLASTAGDGSTASLFQDSSPVGALGAIQVSAGDQPDELFSAVQFADGSLRRTVVMRHDAGPSALTGADFRSAWSYDSGVSTDRPALLASGPRADTLVVATYDSGAVHVDWLNPSTGARLSRVTRTGAGLSALSLSEAGDRVALLAGLDLWVIDRTGVTWHHGQLQVSTNALALSEDGGTLAFGDFGLVHVFVEAAGEYSEVAGIAGQADELPTRISLARDGATLAVGWWRFSNGVDVRLEVWDHAQQLRLVRREQLGAPGGYQNFPEAVELSADGSRVAFGLWGLGDAKPELYLIDVAADTELLAVDLPGSVRALDLDETGTRVALGVKHGHANDFGTSGAVMLLDTGERDLQLLQPPVRGGKLALATEFAGQQYTIFLLGAEADAGAPVMGWSGLNWIDTTKPFLWRGAAADGNGFSTRNLQLPDQPSLVGLELAIQAVFVGPDGVALSEALLRPVIY